VIDHCAITETLYDKTNAVKIIDTGIKLSDHCLLIPDTNIPVSDKLSK